VGEGLVKIDDVDGGTRGPLEQELESSEYNSRVVGAAIVPWTGWRQLWKIGQEYAQRQLIAKIVGVYQMLELLTRLQLATKMLPEK
jgi:hypothetical protein